MSPMPVVGTSFSGLSLGNITGGVVLLVLVTGFLNLLLEEISSPV
jgi:hypothetical protein